MKLLIRQLLTSSKGRLVSLSVGAAVGFATMLATRWGFTLDPEAEKLLVSAVTLGVAWAIDSVVLYLNAEGTKEIQQPLNVLQDGVPGPVTQNAVRNIAANQKEP